MVSTSPAVAANSPVSPNAKPPGAFVACIGQVHVRCRGPVSCGDVLVPSGRNDGCAVAASSLPMVGDGSIASVLGSALESSYEDVETCVTCFVQWQHHEARCDPTIGMPVGVACLVAALLFHLGRMPSCTAGILVAGIAYELWPSTANFASLSRLPATAVLTAVATSFIALTWVMG